MVKLTIIILMCWSSCLYAQGSKQIEREADTEFRRKLQDLNGRYEDFFIHHQEKSRQAYEREIAAQDQAERRKARLDYRKEARQNFIRPKKSVRDKSQYLERVMRREKAKDKSQQAYINRRIKLEKIRTSARKIPQRQEVGLDSVGSVD